MAAKSRLDLVQKQGLALSAGMRSSLGLLRMPTQALADAIAREAEENPFLVLDYPAAGPSAYDVALDTTAAPVSLADRIRRQVMMQRLDQRTEAAALYLIGELRDDGYLDADLDEIATATGAPLAVLEAGLAALQASEPAGIGARNLAECLELKLFDAGIDRPLARAAADRLSDFAEERWALLGRSLGVDRGTIERIAGLLRGFGSAPLEPGEEASESLVPELSVEVGPQGELMVSLVSGLLPTVTQMPVPRASLAGEVLRDLHDRAGRMAAGIAARQETLLRIGTYIAETQPAFFRQQRDSIAPVTRNDAASALAMHPSTLGRALGGKAVVTRGTLYPLSLFFSRAIPGPDGALSPFDVQRRIRALIAAETAGAPLTDEAICGRLHAEGVDIARRTVAKYRKCMRIPSSFGRKRRKVSATGHPRTMRKAE